MCAPPWPFQATRVWFCALLPNVTLVRAGEALVKARGTGPMRPDHAVVADALAAPSAQIAPAATTAAASRVVWLLSMCQPSRSMGVTPAAAAAGSAHARCPSLAHRG